MCHSVTPSGSCQTLTPLLDVVLAALNQSECRKTKRQGYRGCLFWSPVLHMIYRALRHCICSSPTKRCFVILFIFIISLLIRKTENCSSVFLWNQQNVPYCSVLFISQRIQTVHVKEKDWLYNLTSLHSSRKKNQNSCRWNVYSHKCVVNLSGCFVVWRSFNQTPSRISQFEKPFYHKKKTLFRCGMKAGLVAWREHCTKLHLKNVTFFNFCLHLNSWHLIDHRKFFAEKGHVFL